MVTMPVTRKADRINRKVHGTDLFPVSGMPLYTSRVRLNRPFPLHTHDFTELVFVHTGQGLHTTETRKHPVCCGDIFVIHENEPHGYADVSGFSVVNICFRQKELGLPLMDMQSMPGYRALFSLEPQLRREHGVRNQLRLTLKELAQVEAMTEQIRHAIERKTAGYKALALIRLSELLLRISRYYEKTGETDAASLIRLGESLNYMESRFQQKITLKELADVAHMSQSPYQRAFQKALDCSPIRYLIRYRVRKAAELLRDPSISISQAGFQSGFDDSNYFSRQFKLVMGMSPREYR